MTARYRGRTMIVLLLRGCALALALLGWAVAPAFAEPQRISSDPEPNQQFHDAAPGQVSMTFSEPLDESSDVKVKDDCGDRVDDGEVTVGGTAENEISIGITRTVQSTYTVTYTVTGVTGTATGGYSFVVHGGKPCTDSGGSEDAHGEHGGSDGGGGDDDQNGGHDGHAGSGSGQENSSGQGGHSSSSHSGNSGGNTGQSTMSAQEHQNMTAGTHPAGHDMDEPGKHKSLSAPTETSDRPPIAAAAPTLATDIPTGTTILVALGLAMLLGVVGGWVLRVSSLS